MARYAPCAEAARQRLRTERVHRRPEFSSMRNTNEESDAESNADTESIVVDESTYSVVGDAVQPSAKLRMRSRLETGQTMLVE